MKFFCLQNLFIIIIITLAPSFSIFCGENKNSSFPSTQLFSEDTTCNYQKSNSNFITITSSKTKFFSKCNSNQVAPINFNAFGESFTILEREGRCYLLTSSKIDTPIYIKKQRLSDNNSGRINDSEFLENEGDYNFIRAIEESNSLLTQKTLIFNNIQKDKNKHPSKRVSLFDNPDLLGEPIKTISIFEIRFLYGISKKSYLVGRTDSFNIDNSKSVVEGWVSQDYAILWNNRIGVEFNKRNFFERNNCELGIIYNEKRHKIVSAKEGKSQDPLPYYANRYPLIKKYNDEEIQIAYIGNDDNKNQSETIFDDPKITRAKEKFSNLIKNRNIQIAFLIDATKGMKNHISNVKKAINSFFLTFSNKSRGNKTKLLPFEISFVVYRDYMDGDKVFEKICDFTKDVNVLTKKLNAIKVYSSHKDNGPGTYPEALYNGINLTLDLQGWKLNKGEKYILLLGDHGNHEEYNAYMKAENYYNHNLEYFERNRLYSPEMIGKKLQDEAFILYAIQVNININKDMHYYNKLFESQLSNIIKKNENFGRLIQVKKNSTQEIYQCFLAIMSDFTKISEELYKLRIPGDFIKVTNNNQNENTKGLERIYHERMAKKILKMNNIPDCFNATQICQLVFVNRYNKCNQKQINESVLMLRNDIEFLRTQMASLSEAVRNYRLDSSEYFEEVVKGVVSALSGETPDVYTNIADFIAKKSGIPIMTDMLKKSLIELKSIIQNIKFRKKLRKYLQERILMLNEVVNERKVNRGKWIEKDEKFDWDFSPKEIKYFFSLEQPLLERGIIKIKANKNIYAWIPIEFLP